MDITDKLELLTNGDTIEICTMIDGVTEDFDGTFNRVEVTEDGKRCVVYNDTEKVACEDIYNVTILKLKNRSYDNYTLQDICDDLFNFTDAMYDGCSPEEQIELDALRTKFIELCKKEG